MSSEEESEFEERVDKRVKRAKKFLCQRKLRNTRRRRQVHVKKGNMWCRDWMSNVSDDEVED